MAWAEFEEKEYEIAMAVELADGGLGAVFSSGQVVEAILGYDAVAAVDTDNVIWGLLGVPRPSGIRLVPDMWLPAHVPPAARLPETPISLILQYKRPEFLSGARAKQWHFWHRPYYRFTRTQPQQRVLLRLTRRLGTEALVRYAAPAFHLISELEAHHLRRRVITPSGFVDPVSLSGHKVWTYVDPGTHGLANPSRRIGEFEHAETIRARLIVDESASTATPVRRAGGWIEHVIRVGQAAVDREPSLRRDLARWRSALERSGIPLQAESVKALVAVAAITSLMAREHGAWYLGGSGT